MNNAGIACSSEIEWCPVETFQRMLDVNTTGAVRVTKAFLPQLRESRGRVVIVASLAGIYNIIFLINDFFFNLGLDEFDF